MAKISKASKDTTRSTKYEPLLRRKISNIIRTEWEAMKDKVGNGSQFVAHIEKKLKAEGIKAPDGRPLSTRGVRYQVLRSGIFFRGIQGPVSNDRSPGLPPSVKPTLPKFLEAIILDDSINPPQKVKLIKAFFEID